MWLRDVETPYVEGSLVEIGRVGEEAGAGVRASSPGCYARTPAITVTVVVLAIVFVTAR